MLIQGDALEMGIKSTSVDAIVCDPPYGLEFMGKDWDSFNAYNAPQNKERTRKIRYIKEDGTPVYWLPPIYVPNAFKYQGKDQRKRNLHFQEFSMKWLTEAYRVLKPGGSMLVMGGTRTSHRLACAIEDTGFIIKDTLMWLYGSGFPKAQDLGKMIKKRGGDGEHWDGFKVGGIKPAYEPIIWAVKPPEGSYVDNVIKWGVGAVNVDECRVGSGGDYTVHNMGSSESGIYEANKSGKFDSSKEYNLTKGRFPANVILDEEAGEMLDEQSKRSHSSGIYNNKSKSHKNMFGINANRATSMFGDSGGASRFFYCAKASRGERNAGLEGMENSKPKNLDASGKGWGITYPGGSERPRNSIKNNHPTVKPIKLFEWLIKLVTREGQIVLDPFIGSGTTAIAAYNTGRKCIGIEKEWEYLEIAKGRIEYWEGLPRQLDL